MRIVFILILLTVVYTSFLGDSYLFDWDEINFAESAREMIVTGDYLRVQIDFKPFHEKPPLFIWLQVASMKVFGINEFAARLPNAIIGVLSMLVIYLFGKKLYDSNFGVAWIAAYAGSFLPTFYFKSGIIDPLFNLFIFTSVFGIYLYYKNQNSKKYLLLSSILISLAVLTKGPVGLLLVSITWLIFQLTNKEYFKFKLPDFILFVLIGIIPYFIWYTIAYGGETNILFEFIDYHIRLLTTGDAGHKGPFFYHFVVLLFGAFPASILAFKGFKKLENDDHIFNSMNIILICVVLLVFSLVKTKILHYSSLAYFPLTFFAARGLMRVNKENFKLAYRIIVSLSIVYFTVFFLIPSLEYYANDLSVYVKDRFTKDILNSEIDELGSSSIYAFFLLIGIIKLKYSERSSKDYQLFLAFTGIALLSFMQSTAPLISSFTQKTPIEFYQSKQNEDCYIEPLSFKTYAHYFYSNRQKANTAAGNSMKYNEFKEMLLEGEIDKTAYFVTKSTKYEKYLNQYDLELIEVKNGWAFLKRSP